MTQQFRSTGVALILLLGLAQRVAAQQRPFDTDDPKPLGSGQVRIAEGVTFGHDVTYPLSGLEGDLWQVALLRLDVGLGPLGDFELSGGPYNLLSIASRRTAPFSTLVPGGAATTHAVEDIQVGAKIQLLAESEARPAFGFRFSVRLPNAKHESGLGQDTTDFSAALLGAKTIARLRVIGNAGVTIMSEPLDATKQNDVLTYGLALALAVGSGVDIVADVNGRASERAGDPPVGTESRGIAKAGARWTNGRVQFDAALLVGLTRLDPSVGATLGVSFIIPASDRP